MAPIGSKVIEVKGQIYVVFFCLFLPGPWADLHQTWREGGGRPRILASGVQVFERSKSSRSKVKVMFFFLFVPLLLPGPRADLHQTWWGGGGRPRILARGVHFLKVKVSLQSFVRFG